MEDFIRIGEAAALLKLSRSRIYELVHLGQIPFYKIPQKIGTINHKGRLLFNKTELLSWLIKGKRDPRYFL